MKAFRVKYNTEQYMVFSELVLVPDEADIPKHLETHSDKGFVIGDPRSKIESATEVPIEDLPIRDLTIGELFALIDSRKQNEPEARKEPADHAPTPAAAY